MGFLQSVRDRLPLLGAGQKSLTPKNPQLQFIIDAMMGNERDTVAGREYNASLWVYSAANVWASASSCPLVAYGKKRNTDTAVDLPFFLRSPNPDQSLAELLEISLIHLAIFGRAMWLIDEGEYTTGREPSNLRIIHPDKMTLDRDDIDYLGRISQWTMTAGNRTRKIQPESVVYVALPNPYKLGRWQSPLDALRDTVDADWSARRHNKYLMTQHGRVPGVISYDDDLTEDELKRRSRTFHELYGSPEAAGKWLHVVKTKVQQMSMTSKDMDWEAGLKIFREEVAAAFRIPPPSVGILDKATYSNMEQADRALVEHCFIPNLRRFESAIDKQLIDRAGIDARVYFDVENHYQALQESEGLRIEKYTKLVLSGVSPEQAAALCDIDIGEITDAHRSVWMPTNMVAVHSPTSDEDNVSVSGPVQDQALNGAQISSLLEVLAKISEGVLTPEGAVGVLVVAFPSIDEAEARRIVAGALKKQDPVAAEKLLRSVDNAGNENTDFPKSGDNKKVSLRNSNFEQFDYDFALNIRENHPEVWGKGGNIRGNTAFTNWGKAREGSESDAIIEWIREREAWAARHNDNKNIEGVVALMKWGVVGSIGESQMKEVINAGKKKSVETREADSARVESLRSAVWRSQMQRRLPYEKKLQKAMKKFLFDQRVEALANLDAMLSIEPGGTKGVITKAMPSASEIAQILIAQGWDKELISRLEPILLSAGQAAAMRLLEDLKLRNDLFSEAAITNFVRQQAELLPRVNQSTRDALTKSAQDVLDAVSGGLSIDDAADQLRENVRGVFGGSEARATTIARTEIGRAMEGARFEQMKGAGIATKVWISSRDSEVRDLHKTVDGEEVPVDARFSNGLLYPMDPGASAAQTVNCRCTSEVGSFAE